MTKVTRDIIVILPSFVFVVSNPSVLLKQTGVSDNGRCADILMLQEEWNNKRLQVWINYVESVDHL